MTTEKSSELTLEQQRAKFALEKVNALSKEGKEKYGNYKGYVEGFPAAILMDGLGQACATLMAKAKPKGNAENQRERSGQSEKGDAGAKFLFEHLQEWLCKNSEFAPYKGKNDLMQAIVDTPQQTYVQAQAEAMALLVWLKKFSQAFLETKGAGGSHG